MRLKDIIQEIRMLSTADQYRLKELFILTLKSLFYGTGMNLGKGYYDWKIYLFRDSKTVFKLYLLNFHSFKSLNTF